MFKKERCLNHRMDDKVKKSLKYSIIDGAFYSAMVGFGESFFSAFAVFLQASNLQLGILGSMPQTLGSIVQLLSNRFIALFKSRKTFILYGVLLQALMFIPISLVYLFGELRIYHLIFFVCLYWIFGLILDPAWNSWMGDLVDEKKRGRYFGRRNRIAGSVTLIAFFLAGMILQYSSVNKYIGFVIIFMIALISRLLSWVYLSKQYHPRYRFSKAAQFSFMDFVKRARETNFGHFVLFMSAMNFFVFLSAPFFTAYMLYDLEFSYLTFTLINCTSLLVKILVMPLWGKASDRFGRKKVLTLAGFLMPLTPLLWLFSSSLWYLLAIQVYAGFVWAGFEIAAFNYIFDTVQPSKRARCVAYYNVVNGSMIFIGGIAGGLIASLPAVLLSSYYMIFLISGLGRYCVSLLFLHKLEEPRTVRPISYHRLFYNVAITMPTQGVMHEIALFKKR